MSIKKIIAITVIFFIGSAGWAILGTATAVRSKEFTRRLSPQVESLWGSALVQKAPSFTVQIPGSNRVKWLMPAANHISVKLLSDYRKKGLVWYSTYTCEFEGLYTINNTEEVRQEIRIHFDFPAKGGTYRNFGMYMDKNPLVSIVDTSEGVSDIIELNPGERADIKIKYNTRGINTWKYQMDPNAGRVQKFHLKVTTNFHDVDYTERSLSPMTIQNNDKCV